MSSVRDALTVAPAGIGQQFVGNIHLNMVHHMAPAGCGGGCGSRLVIPEMIIAEIAEDAIDSYRQFLGEASKPWADRPPEYKENCARGVRIIFENPHITAEMAHDLWVASRCMEGWTYGPEQDLDLKTHPLMVRWDLVPVEQRRKDELFIQIVRAFIEYGVD